jgi:hypothetical protein
MSKDVPVTHPSHPSGPSRVPPPPTASLPADDYDELADEYGDEYGDEYADEYADDEYGSPGGNDDDFVAAWEEAVDALPLPVDWADRPYELRWGALSDCDSDDDDDGSRHAPMCDLCDVPHQIMSPAA